VWGRRKVGGHLRIYMARRWRGSPGRVTALTVEESGCSSFMRHPIVGLLFGTGHNEAAGGRAAGSRNTWRIGGTAAVHAGG
jgi:hypothetical protein